MSVVVDCTRRPSGRKAPVVQPFAQLPHHIASDPRLSPTDVRVLLALLYFAKAKPDCWPCDASIAGRVGRSIPTVQRSLRHLQGLGYIDRMSVATNPTGRLIVLRWRPSPSPIGNDRPPRSRVIDPPRSRMIDEGLDKEGEQERPEAAAGCWSPPPPAGTTTEAALPTPEEHAKFVRGLAGYPRQDWRVRLALANGRVTETELAALAGDEAPPVVPGPATPPDAGSPARALAAPTAPQAAAPTEAETRPTAAAPDRPPSAAADAAGPGEDRRPTAHVRRGGSSNPSRRASSASARSIRALGVARHFSASRVSQARHSGDPRIEMMLGNGPPSFGLLPGFAPPSALGPPRRVEVVSLRFLAMMVPFARSWSVPTKYGLG